MEIVGSVSFNHSIMEADMKGSSPYFSSADTVDQVKELKKKIESSLP